MATATVAATDLRAELKDWERAFADANGGKKAGRYDIKNNPDIAAKYKEYGRLKALESRTGKDKHIEATLEARPKKRKHTSPTGPGHDQHDITAITTPRKSSKATAPFTTPSQPRASGSNHPSQIDPYDSPSALRRLFSPSTHQTPLKTAVGPTPQRDGQALGLFDLLSESGGSTATPSANRLASIRGDAVHTPSRRKRGMDTITEENEDEEQEEETLRGGRTPASSGKKWYLANLFATPTTLRYAAMVEDEEERSDANKQPPPAGTGTEGRTATGQGETPSFLRRSNTGRSFNALGPSNGGLSPIVSRKPPQFVGKGLSALVQGLRDMEEERLEDDLDVLREIEADQEAMENGGVDVADSQKPAENGGRRPYKKKGQKRTTRGVRMKPVTVPKAQANPSEPVEGDTEDEDEDELAAVSNTQLPETEDQVSDDHGKSQGEDEYDEASVHTMSEPDLDDSDADYDQPATKTKSFSEKMQEAISADSRNQPQTDSQPSEKPKAKPKRKEEENGTESTKPARKVNPATHANYRSLKIRSRGSRGRGAGRFGRR